MDDQEGVDACERCGLTNFEEVNGITFCLNGHEQAGGQRRAEDEDDYGTEGKIIRKKVAKEKIKVTRGQSSALSISAAITIWCFSVTHHS